MSILPASAERRPLYLQIQERVRDAIFCGAIGPGGRIWSENELALEFGTTRTTVRHALDRLAFEGTIVRKPGRGSFAAETSSFRAPIDSRECLTFEEQAARDGYIVTYRSPSFRLVRTPSDVRKTLGIAEDSQVFKFERLRVIAGRPVCFERRFIPREIGRFVTGDMLAGRPAHSFVEDILGEHLPTIAVSITADVVRGRFASLLGLAEGSPVIVRSSTDHTRTGVVVMCGRCVFAGDVSTDYVLGSPLPTTKASHGRAG